VRCWVLGEHTWWCGLSGLSGQALRAGHSSRGRVLVWGSGVVLVVGGCGVAAGSL